MVLVAALCQARKNDIQGISKICKVKNNYKYYKSTKEFLQGISERYKRKNKSKGELIMTKCNCTDDCNEHKEFLCENEAQMILQTEVGVFQVCKKCGERSLTKMGLRYRIDARRN